MLTTPITFLATKHAEAAREFYGDVLGLTLVSDERFALVFDLAGSQLRIQKVEKVVPAPYTVLGWSVADIRSTVEELERRGVVFERFHLPSQDERGIWVSPAGAKVAWFRDPDGNTLSITEPATALGR